MVTSPNPMDLQVTGIEDLKNKYARDSYFGTIYEDLQQNLLAKHPEFRLHDGYLFYGNRLCLPSTLDEIPKLQRDIERVILHFYIFQVSKGQYAPIFENLCSSSNTPKALKRFEHGFKIRISRKARGSDPIIVVVDIGSYYNLLEDI
jgi:hypothetical protein